MPRGARNAPGGLVYHALNRAVARLPLFEKDGDFAAFERVLAEALEEHPTRLLASCLMPDHWHLVLWPQKDDELTAFVRWLTHTHSVRWHAHYHTGGTGHIYQGRFKSFPVEAATAGCQRRRDALDCAPWRRAGLRCRRRGSCPRPPVAGDRQRPAARRRGRPPRRASPIGLSARVDDGSAAGTWTVVGPALGDA
jgi:REP element-mobilizing transposase RayT